MRFLAALLMLAATVPSSAHAGRLLSVRVDGSGQTTLASDPKASFGPTPCRAADGTITVLAERPSRLSDRSYLIARPGAKARWKRPPGGEILDAAFSPDCTRVAELYYVFPTKSDLSGLLIRETGGKELGRLESDPEEWPTIAWSADGTKFAFDGWERGRGAVLRVVDARNGRVLARHATRQAEVGSQAFSPDGKALVYAEGERVLIIDATTGNARALAGGKDGRYFRAPAWSPRGDQIAAVNSGGGVELLDPQTGHGPALETSAIFAEDMVWSPDASMIAMRFSSAKPGMTRWGLAVVATAPGSRPRELVKPGGSTTLPVWDAASLVFGR
jgi:Tol biopolymer transport system component